MQPNPSTLRLSLFARLVDDAGLFPPEELAMGAALRRHRADDAAGDTVLSGRFVCPASRLDELTGELEESGHLPLALIVSPFESESLAESLARVAADGRLGLSSVEGTIAGSELPHGLPQGVPAFVEIPVTGDWEEALQLLASSACAAKIRCGGARPELFPTSQQLGRLIHACAEAQVPFKATAGLHHAVRYRDEGTGFTHHGYLNLLIAASRAAAGASQAEVVGALDVSEATTLVAEAKSAAPELARATRRLFVSYGSCSTSEPTEDLRALGLLEEEAAVT